MIGTCVTYVVLAGLFGGLFEPTYSYQVRFRDREIILEVNRPIDAPTIAIQTVEVSCKMKAGSSTAHRWQTRTCAPAEKLVLVPQPGNGKITSLTVTCGRGNGNIMPVRVSGLEYRRSPDSTLRSMTEGRFYQVEFGPTNATSEFVVVDGKCTYLHQRKFLPRLQGKQNGDYVRKLSDE